MTSTLLHRALAGLTALLALAGPAAAGDAPYSLPIFDAHLHYNREPEPRLPERGVADLLGRAGVTGILANSRPNDGTRALLATPPAGVTIVPFLRPYRNRADVQTWFRDPSIVPFVEEELRRARYRGLGEFHVFGAGATTDIVKDLVLLAEQRGLMLFAHCDEEALEHLFGHAPGARILWAHTGFDVPEGRVAQLLARHPSLVAELSYRSGITGTDGSLTDVWRDLFTRFPDRFVVGSDTWIDQRWDDYENIIAGYRAWLGQLPPDIARRIAHDNAREWLGR
jgi:hypothetical protein